MRPTLICYVCNRSFERRFSLKRHFTSVHPGCEFNEPPKTLNKCFKCAICSEVCSEFNIFKNHLLEVHNIPLNIETHEFKNKSDFFIWKRTLEDTQHASFVKARTGKSLADKSISTSFYCHRSGYYKCTVTSKDRKRKIKIQGSSKINAYCPAKMKVIFYNDGPVSVDYCDTHVGHQNELAHLNLNEIERKDIAAKIAMKLPYDTILNGIRPSVSKENLKRKHLITKHDLYNIEKEFSLNSEAVRNATDAASVDAWVDMEKQSENSCILVYKPQGVVLPEFPGLTRDDFLLCTMTEAQEEILTKYSSGCVCIDVTHGMNSKGFEMVTLLVLDDLKQGFPCAFCISNRTDKDGLETFFKAIKQKIGVISCKVFMSDMAEYFYNAWQNIMTEPQMRLFSAWHVIRAWRQDLVKIKDSEKRKLASESLRTLLEETDRNAFELRQESIVQKMMEDDVTKEFAYYFKQHYVKFSKLWAYCYRTNAGITTYMNLESMHKTLEDLFLKGKTEKRLDRALHAIMQLIKTKLFDRLIVMEKGKQTSKLKLLRARHERSLKMNSELVSSTGNNSWVIASSSSQIYSVRLVDSKCNCSLLCTYCNACIHQYSCTCIDSCIQWNMCKHIHLLCRILNAESSELSCQTSAEGNYSGNTEEKDSAMSHEDAVEKAVILKEVASDVVSEFFLKKLRSEVLEELSTVISGFYTAEEINLSRQKIKSIVPVIHAIKQRSETTSLPIQSSCKNITFQRRVISKKKKRQTSARQAINVSKQRAVKIALNASIQSKPSTSSETLVICV